MAKLNNDSKAVIDNSITADLMNIQQQQEEAPPPPPPPPPPEMKQEAKFVAPVVVDTVKEVVEIATTDQVLATTTNDQVQEEVVEVQNTVVEEEAPAFMVVEEMPVFPGGDAALMNYIVSSIKYPEICKENNISGKVFVNFVVDENGKVCKVKVVRGVDPYLDREAIRVIESLPGWTPGKQRGKAVKVQYTLPINFALY
jgi:protein TonB